MPLPAGSILAYDTRTWTEGDGTLENLGSGGATYDLVITSDGAYDNAYGTQVNDYYGYLSVPGAIAWADLGGTPDAGGVFTFIFATGNTSDGAGYAQVHLLGTGGTEAISPSIVNYDGTFAGPTATVDMPDPALFVDGGLHSFYDPGADRSDTLYFIEIDLSGTPYIEIRETEGIVASDTKAPYGGGVIDGIYDPGSELRLTIVGADTGWAACTPWRMRGMAMVRGTLDTAERAAWVTYFTTGDGDCGEEPPPEPVVSAPDRYVAVGTVKPVLGDLAGLDVWILNRALNRKLMPVPWSATRFNRIIDEVSEASATVPWDSQAILAGLTPWRHGLGFFIDGQLEWAGPIYSVKRDAGNPTDLSIRARDRLAWMNKRRVRNAITLNADLGYIFDQLILEGTSRDNRFGLYSNTPPTGVSAERDYPANSDQFIFAALQDLARTGMDFTMVRATLFSGPTDGLFSDRLLVGPDAFIGYLGVELDGLSQANSTMTAGAGTGGSEGYTILAEVDEWDTDIGLLDDFVSEESITDQAGAAAASRTRWDKLHDCPKIVSFPALSQMFPSRFADLIPGKLLRVQVDDDFTELRGDYRLTQVTLDATVDSDGRKTNTVTIEAGTA